jgi:hypothetical protein
VYPVSETENMLPLDDYEAISPIVNSFLMQRRAFSSLQCVRVSCPLFFFEKSLTFDPTVRRMCPVVCVVLSIEKAKELFCYDD